MEFTGTILFKFLHMHGRAVSLVPRKPIPGKPPIIPSHEPVSRYLGYDAGRLAPEDRFIGPYDRLLGDGNVQKKVAVNHEEARRYWEA